MRAPGEWSERMNMVGDLELNTVSV
jgi:hypothetical protein